MELTLNQPSTATGATTTLAAPATTPTTEPAAPNGHRTAILAIDDNTDFLQLLKDLLEPSGYDVYTVVNPVKALELFQRDKDKYKVILLDYYMPQLDGAKTFEWLRKINPNVRVIVCSGADELRLRQIQAQNKIDAYLHKPFRVQEALTLINRIAKLPAHGTN